MLLLFKRKRLRMKLCSSILLLSLATPLCLARNPVGKTSPASDREQYGLRGPVKTCVEETTYGGGIASDGTPNPELTRWSQKEYDVNGHLVANRDRNPDGSMWMVRNTYDASGKLIKTTSGKDGEPPTVSTYVYDDQQRLTSIISSGARNNPVTFRYDERGRKTKVQVSRAEDYRANVATCCSPLEAADMPPNLPGGGTAVTTYDENDRPTEVQVRNAQGEVVNRAVRIYDQQGNIEEEKQILDDPLTIIPAEARASISATSATSAEELRAQLVKLLAGHEGATSTSYIYDAQGRIKETRQRFFNHEERIEITYNEQGDKAVEVTQAPQTGSEQEQNALPAENSEARYSYQYDEHGNWTEQITSYSSNPGRTFETSSTIRRTLTYF